MIGAWEEVEEWAGPDTCDVCGLHADFVMKRSELVEDWLFFCGHGCWAEAVREDDALRYHPRG